MKRKKNHYGMKIGLLCGTGAFIVLSFLAGGLVEFSREVGFFRWLVDMLTYTVLNKIGYKLAASVGIGVTVAFITNMSAYGKAVKQHKVQRVQFRQEEEADRQTSRIA